MVFLGGLEFKDSVLSLLWLRFDPWPGNFPIYKKKKIGRKEPSTVNEYRPKLKYSIMKFHEVPEHKQGERFPKPSYIQRNKNEELFRLFNIKR